jgi:hypothetical protein
MTKPTTMAITTTEITEPQAMRTQRINVARLGGLPNMSEPTRKTLAANQSAP